MKKGRGGHGSKGGEREREEFKYPRTQHLFDAGGTGVARDDLLMDAKDAAKWLAAGAVVIEEKVDGANLGVDVDPDTNKLRFRNRAHFVTSATSSQFKQLDSWASQQSNLHSLLQKDYILFGEWLYAKHSLRYTRLPDLFMAFDVYNKSTKTFMNADERNVFLQGTGIQTVRRIDEGLFTKDQLLQLLDTPSLFYDGFVEGLFLRRSTGDQQERAKVVRPDFLQSDSMETHWSKNELVKNIVSFELQYE